MTRAAPGAPLIIEHTFSLQGTQIKNAAAIIFHLCRKLKHVPFSPLYPTVSRLFVLDNIENPQR